MFILSIVHGLPLIFFFFTVVHSTTKNQATSQAIRIDKHITSKYESMTFRIVDALSDKSKII